MLENLAESDDEASRVALASWVAVALALCVWDAAPPNPIEMCVLVVALAAAIVDWSAEEDPTVAAAEVEASRAIAEDDSRVELEAGSGWTNVEEGSTGAGAGAADDEGSTTAALLDGAGATKVLLGAGAT